MPKRKSKRLQKAGRKHQNKKEKQENPSRPLFTTKITDINDDCLEQIFRHLPFRDFLNVADTTKRFKNAVELVYANKYGRVRTSLSEINPNKYIQMISSYPGKWLDVFGMIFSLKVLRLFGHLISHLVTDYAKSEPRYWTEIERYLNKYCADSLIKIEFFTIMNGTNFKKSFSKVESVKFTVCKLMKKSINFNKWFPKMKSLTFYSSNPVHDSKCIEKHFPNLMEFSLDRMFIDHEKPLFSRANIAEAMRLNPNLRSLTLKVDIPNAKFIHSISNNLQSLETLKIRSRRFGFFNLRDGVAHFKNVKQFELDLYAHDDDNEDIDDEYNDDWVISGGIPLSFDKLEEYKLGLYGDDDFLNREFIDFIRKQPSLIKFTFDTWGNHFDKADDQIKLATASQSLTDIEFAGDEDSFSTDEVINFLDKCKPLKKFRCKVKDYHTAEYIQRKFKNMWNVSIKYKDYSITQYFIRMERLSQSEQ